MTVVFTNLNIKYGNSHIYFVNIFAKTTMTYSSNPHFTSKQLQVIYGTMLGGSSIVKPPMGKNSYLSMRNKNKLYLAYKVSELECLFKTEDSVIKKDKNTFRCFSVSYPIFNDLYGQFYNKNLRIIKDEILDSLTHVSWMIWFLDCGKKFNNKARLRTSHLGLDNTKKIKNYFDSLDFSCEIIKLGTRTAIEFKKDVFEKYIGTFFSLVPKFMLTDVV